MGINNYFIQKIFEKRGDKKLKRISILLILMLIFISASGFSARFRSLRAIKRAGRSSIGKTARLRIKFTSVYPSPKVSDAVTPSGARVSVIVTKRLCKKIRTGRYYSITGRVKSINFRGGVKIRAMRVR